MPATDSAPERHAAVRPRDAATLIIVRNDAAEPRILMGKRHAGHRFMPNLFVFPGGRVDPADCRVAPAEPLHPEVERKLMARMRGTASPLRARGLAMAAIRETFEETGFVIGRPMDRPGHSRSAGWAPYLATGHRPDLAPLRYLARAITPPGGPKRFDTRFFVVDARHVANLECPVETDSDELLDRHWLSIADTERLELPAITRKILSLLEQALERPRGMTPDAPVTFQYVRARKWVVDTL